MEMRRSWNDAALIAQRPDFRSDINGLRAWAVVAVIFYHFGIPGFGGGFVGVDVFFVISGFLMTGIVIRGLERGTLSIPRFYLARAIRIMPALAALCAVLLVLGWLVLLPPDYMTLSRHAIASLSFVSNLIFWREAGYFDSASHEKWLLHTWSLSAEWQFYMLLPIASWGLWRLFPGRLAQRRALLIACALSLGASVCWSAAHSSLAFYLLPLRAWEMLAGGIVFLFVSPQVGAANGRRAVEAGGLLLIMLSVLLLDRHAIWPGGLATLPVAAAMLVLSACRNSFWTGNRLVQWLGDRSYSLYLWHWPVVVGLSYIDRLHDGVALVVSLGITFLLAHVSYHWVECSTRRRLGRLSPGHVAACLAVVGVMLVLCGIAVSSWHGMPGRFPSTVERIADEVNNYNPRRRECHAVSGATSPSCVYGGATWKLVVVGDSHAGALVSAVAAAAPEATTAGVVQLSYSACAFAHGLKKTPASLLASGADYRCSDFIGWVERRLETLEPAIPALVINRYAAAALGPNEDGLAFDRPDVYFSKIYPTTTPAFLDEFSRNLTQSACLLAKRRTVYLMRPIPEMGVNVPQTLARRLALGLRGDISISLAEYRKRNAWVWAAQDAARAQCGVRILDPLPYLCRNGRCYGSREGQPLYHDDDHLSETGNKLLVPMFSEIFGKR